MKIDKYIVFILLSLIIIYLSQNVFYTGGGSLIAQLSLFLILLVSGFYFIKTMLIRKKPLFINVWTILLLINLIGYIFTADFSFRPHFDHFKTILIVSLVFYPFFYLSLKGVLKSNHLICFFLIMLPITIAQFYFQTVEVMVKRQNVNVEFVNNFAYQFVFLIPYLFLLKKRKIASFFLALIMLFFIIQGAKRGAMIIGTVGILFFIYFHLRTIERRNRYKGFIFVIVGIAGLVYFAYTFYQQNEFLISRLSSISDGDSSSRNIIYSNLYNTWFKSESLINFLFGYGFGSSIFLSGTGNWAHNDWLELLINFGILGVIVYAAIFFSIIRFAFSKYCNADKKIILLSIIAIWFLTTLISMNYNNINSIFQSIIMAYLIGNKSMNIE